jgi:hypothetical protein
VPPDPIAAIGAPVVTAFLAELTSGYEQLADPQEWFDQIRAASRFRRQPEKSSKPTRRA